MSTVVLSPTAKLSKSVPGLNATVPSALIETEPSPVATWASVTDSVSPSMSVSLARTLMSIETFSSVVALSSTATGPSLVPLMVTVATAVSVPPLPSLIV